MEGHLAVGQSQNYHCWAGSSPQTYCQPGKYRGPPTTHRPHERHSSSGGIYKTQKYTSEIQVECQITCIWNVHEAGLDSRNWLIGCIWMRLFLLTIGSFLLTVELFLLTIDNFSFFYLQLTVSSFFTYSWRVFAYSFSFFYLQLELFAYSGKVCLIRTLRDCKRRSLTVSKKAPTVSPKASPVFWGEWCANCRNLRKRQTTHHPQFCTHDVDRRFCGGGAWISWSEKIV